MKEKKVGRKKSEFNPLGKVSDKKTVPLIPLFQLAIFDIFNFYHGSEAWGNKTKEMNHSSLNLDVITFVLFLQVSEAS